MTTMPATAGRAEQTRARYPDDEGYVERDGVRVFYEVYGERRADDPAAADLVDHPLAALEGADPVPRAPLPRASRSTGAATAAPTGRAASTAYAEREFAADALAVMDATGTERAVLVGALGGRAVGAAARRRASRAGRGPRCSSRPPSRSAAVAPRARLDAVRRASSTPTRAGRSTTATTGSSDYRGFLEFFFAQVFTEPHSTKQIEDCVGWGLETTPETLVATQLGARAARPSDVRASCAARIACPVLVIHGDRGRGSGRSTRAPRSPR